MVSTHAVKLPLPLSLVLLLLLCSLLANGGVIPKLIHQTVRSKANLSCEEIANVESWRALNRDHVHRLWDDQELLVFVRTHYPGLSPLPFEHYLTGTERADVFRLLVLHTLGGIYADIDVECVQPIRQWPMRPQALTVLGVEYYSFMKDNPKLINWVMAAAPHQPIFRAVPRLLKDSIVREFFALARSQQNLTTERYTGGIVARTGPDLLSAAADIYLRLHNSSLAAMQEREVDAREDGLLVGSLQILPRTLFGSGWETKRGSTCQRMAAMIPSALICHQYWGQWKFKHWERRVLNYSCPQPDLSAPPATVEEGRPGM